MPGGDELKTKGLETNVNDLVNEVIRLTEEKMRAQHRCDYLNEKIEVLKKEKEEMINALKAFQNEKQENRLQFYD